MKSDITPTPAPAIPTRWNSLRTNSSWRIFLIFTTTIIVVFWVQSLLFVSTFEIKFVRAYVELEASASQIQFHIDFRGKWSHGGFFGGFFGGILDLFEFGVKEGGNLFRTEGPNGLLHLLLPTPGQGMGWPKFNRDEVYLSIPYWLILLGALGIQYLLLPKTLPPPKPGETPPATP